MEEIAGGAQLRGGAGGGPDLRHVRGVPDRQEDAADRRRDHRAGVRARRAADGDCDRAQRPRVLHARREPDQGRARPHGVPEARRRRAGAPRHAARSATASCSPAIRSSSRGRPSCSSRARRAASSPRAPKQLREGVNDQQALLIGIKCERGSHKFFKRYGERFEDSEGKQIFLEFADEERAHLDLLIREYRALRERQAPQPRPRAAGAPAAPQSRTCDRSSHPHDRVGRPLHAGGARRARRGGRRHACSSVTDHDTVAGCDAGGRGVRGGAASSSSPASRSPRSATSADVHVLGYFVDPRFAGAARVPRRAAPAAAIDRVRQMIARLARARHPPRRRRDPPARRSTIRAESVGRPWIARALVAGRLRRHRSNEAFDVWLSRGRPGVRAARAARRPKRCSRGFTTPAASRRSRIPGLVGRDEWIAGLAAAGLDALEAYHTDHDAPTTGALPARSPSGCGLAVSGGSDYHARRIARRGRARAACRCRARTSSGCSSTGGTLTVRAADFAGPDFALGSTSHETVGRYRRRPRRDPRDRLGRGHFLVEQHLEPVEALAQLARLAAGDRATSARCRARAARS